MLPVNLLMNFISTCLKAPILVAKVAFNRVNVFSMSIEVHQGFKHFSMKKVQFNVLSSVTQKVCNFYFKILEEGKAKRSKAEVHILCESYKYVF